MERPRIVETIRQTTKRLEKPALAACAATALIACGGNFPGPRTINQELQTGQTTEGRGYTLIMTNKDVPVNVGFIGDGPVNVSEAGILPKDTMVDPVIVFDAGNNTQTAAFACESVRPYLNLPWSEANLTDKNQDPVVCYIFNDNQSFTAADY